MTRRLRLPRPLALALVAAMLAGCADTTQPRPPAPALQSLSSASVPRGAAPAPITATGTGFQATSVVRIGGADRPTEQVGATALRFTPTAGDLAASGTLQVTVHTPAPGGGTSNALPLHVVAPLVAPGDTVAESLPPGVGGMRDFRIAGEAGEEWIVFLQANALTRLSLVDSAASQPIAEVSSDAPGEALEVSSTGRLRLPRTGTYLLHLTPGAGAAYRFQVVRVDRAPEEGPATIRIGDVVREGIGGVGDVDEYTFPGRAGEELNLLVRLESGMSAGLTMALLREDAAVEVRSFSTPTASLDEAGTGRFVLPATGDYTIRFSGHASGTPASAAGRYSFELYPVDRRAELGGSPRLDGPPVAGAVERPGDIDEYPVAGEAGDRVVLRLVAPRELVGGVQAELVHPGLGGVASVTANPSAGADGVDHSVRGSLPRDGAYTLRVQAPPLQPMSRGPFEVEAYTVSEAPEQVPARISIGQRVEGERIDRPGDLDVFTFQGEAGREVTIFFGMPEPSGASLVVGAPGTGGAWNMSVAGTMALDGASTGRFTLADSVYSITVDAHFSVSSGYTGGTGAYAFRVFPIERRPEGRPAAYVLGDTVRGEPLHPAGDIDEYTFTLDAQTTLAIYWRMGDQTPSGAVSGLLYDADGRSVWASFTRHNGALVRRLTLPAGSYRLSVLNQNLGAGGDPWEVHVPTLTYRFSFAPE